MQASKYKAAILPVAGALIGTVVAGPVGLIAGAKIGGMAAIGGGMAGKCLKRQKFFFLCLKQNTFALLTPFSNTKCYGMDLCLSRAKGKHKNEYVSIEIPPKLN